jgi:hypothetical protein
VVTLLEREVIAVQFQPANIANRSIETQRTQAISSEEFHQVAKLLELAKFWSVQPVILLESEGRGWIMEGREGDSYRLIHRTHPDASLVAVSRRMVQMSGLDLPEGFR